MPHMVRLKAREQDGADTEKLVPTHGLEPRTYALQVRCTTSCATSA